MQLLAMGLTPNIGLQPSKIPSVEKAILPSKKLQSKWAFDAKRAAFARSIESESLPTKTMLLAKWDAIYAGTAEEGQDGGKAALDRLVIEDTPLLTKNLHERGTPPKTGLRPLSAWPRCTRWLSFRQTRNPYGAPVLGSWRFSAKWLLGCPTSASFDSGLDHYSFDFAFKDWLREAITKDTRVSALPTDWDDIAFRIALNATDPSCRPFCIGCGHNIANTDLVLERGGGLRGDKVTRISCPDRHLLLDATTIRFD